MVKWVQGSAFPAVNTWEIRCSEAVAVVVERSLFADDTTAVGEKKEPSVGITITKTVMGSFEERKNDEKEESLRLWIGRKRWSKDVGYIAWVEGGRR